MARGQFDHLRGGGDPEMFDRPEVRAGYDPEKLADLVPRDGSPGDRQSLEQLDFPAETPGGRGWYVHDDGPWRD